MSESTESTPDPEWFRGSKVVTHDGKPLLVYHGTDAVFTKAEVNSEMGFHIGTHQQATQVEKFGGILMKGYAKIANPLRLYDEGSFTDHVVAEQLYNRDLITADQFDDLLDLPHPEKTLAIKKMLADQGYDGIVYLNRREALPRKSAGYYDHLDDEEFKERFPDAHDSWIAFHPEQIRFVT